MASFATNITTPATAITTALATAVSNARTLQANMAAGLPGTVLVNLATSSTSWRSDIADLRTTLDSAIADLASVNQRLNDIKNLLAAIGGLD
ncbi:hypothetical protein [Bradyrhizobium sp. Leo170]|uniref:hypothetical protein n=1 Tax=Bradyrhizobium sp. Leo170 TaxID=1571199 RepID=UPI00102EC0DF|nr:hypothetical protein [Bradyrhizobium sp. Leo170]TAI67655.1 hypothetical protein CWO89_01250 [Bradyrhizobium sp. Leo170]